MLTAAAGAGLTWLPPRRARARPDAAIRPAADAVRSAVTDAARFYERDEEGAAYLKYLSAHHLADKPRELYELYQVVSLHVNLLSRRGFIVMPELVETWLWRIDMRDYGWSRKRFGQLVFGKGPFAVEPWFHVLGEKVDGAPTNGRGQTPMVAPWLPPREAGDLSKFTASAVPVVRADWFLHRTAIQAGRDGFGYYDFLELKTRDDFDALVGLDRAAAVKAFREKAAVVSKSGVATSGSRQIFSFGAGNGRVWITKDVSVDSFGQANKNVLDQKFEDLKHDAEEGIGPLPNNLPVAYLSDAAGKLQKTAPDTIAGHDSTATGKDDRIHVGLSCFACHEKAGLKQFADLERKGGRLPFVTSDRHLFDRQRAAYQAEIQHLFDADVALYARAQAEACGLKAAEVSAAYRRCYDAYDAADVTPAVMARDVGLSEKDFLARLKDRLAVKEKGEATIIPLTLSNFLAKDAEPISRGKEEELISFVMPILGYPGLARD